MGKKLAVVDGEADGPIGDVPAHKTIERLIARKVMEMGARFLVGAGSFEASGESLTPDDIADQAWAEYMDLPLKGFRIVMRRMCRQMRAAEVAKARDKILEVPAAYRGDVDAYQMRAVRELTRFVELLAHPDTEPERLAYYVEAFRQLIWQVKRRLRGNATAWEIMLCLYSRQGTGKSTAVAKFGAPLGILFLPVADFSLFSDKFRLRQLNAYYMICLDEMGKASKTDINTVKQVITAPTVQNRAMHTETERQLTRNANFIATTNRPVTSVLVDNSGMRRFVELRCRDDSYTEEFGARVNALDFNLMWGVESGDAASEPPAFKVRDLFAKYQAELCTMSDFEYFATTHLERTDAEHDRLKHMEVYSAYKDFCDMQSRHPIPIQAFAREMKEAFTMKQHRGYWFVIGVKLSPIKE